MVSDKAKAVSKPTESTTKRVDDITKIESFINLVDFNRQQNTTPFIKKPIVDTITSDIITQRDQRRIKREVEELNKKFRSLQKTIFEPNILTQYENPMYNFRLFIARDGADYLTISKEKIIVIAETGSTGFNIKDVNIHSIISMSTLTKNTVSDRITFTILEPQGDRLLDQIRNAALELGIYDHRSMPIWLELTFKGYTPGKQQFINSIDGGIPTGATSEFNDLSSLQFLWKLSITELKTEIDKGGSIYTFNTTPHNQIALRDEARRLEQDIKISAKTLGDFFDKLTKILNDSSNYNLRNQSDRTKRVRQYAFEFPKDLDMASWEIRSPSDNKSEAVRYSQPLNSKKEDENDKSKQLTYTKGTSIEAIIQEIIGSTVEGQSLAIFGEIKRDAADAGDIDKFRKPDKDAVLFMVEPTVKITSYNNIAKLYNIAITYHIRPYSTFQPLLSREQIKDYQENSSKQRLIAITEITNLKKRYDYLFTGLNTEVLDYNIQINNAWFLPLPIFRGQNKDGVATSSRRLKPEKANEQVTQPSVLLNLENASEETLVAAVAKIQADVVTDDELDKKSTEELLLLERTANTIPTDKFGRSASNAARIRISNAINRRRVLEEGQRKLPLNDINTSNLGANNRLFNIKNDINDGINNIKITNQQDIFSISNRNIINKNDRKKQKSNTSIISSSNQDKIGSIFFIEDFEKKSVEIKEKTNTVKNLQTRSVTVSTELSPTIVNYQGNIEGTVTKGRSYFSAVMNQMFGSLGEMISLDLTIRGDPYWLGEPDPLKRIFPVSPSRDLTNADSIILLTFDFPNRYGDGGINEQNDSSAGTGLIDIERGDNTFNGIYRIITVTSEFSNGLFTQKLEGIIDPVTAQQDIISFFTKDQI